MRACAPGMILTFLSLGLEVLLALSSLVLAGVKVRLVPVASGVAFLSGSRNPS